MGDAVVAVAASGPPRGASVTSTAINMIVCTAGAGILSFPYAAQKAGIVVLVAACVLFAVIAAYCDLVMAEEAFLHRKTLAARTFDEVVWRSLGKRHYVLVTLQILIGLTGALVGFMCVAGDLATPVAVQACASIGRANSITCTGLSRREVVIMAFAVLICLPLAGCARVHALRGTSALSVAAVAAVALLVVVRSCLPGGLPAASAAASMPAQTALSSAFGVFLALPIVIYALGNHVQSVNIFLDGAEASQRRYPVSVVLCFVTVSSLYIATGVAGFATFGSDTRGNILTNFGLQDAAADAAKVLMAVHLALVIPVDVVPLRRCFSLALRLWQEQRRRQREEVLAAGMSKAPLLDGDESGAGSEAARLRDLAAAAEEAELALPRLCGTPCSASIAGQTAGFVLGAAAIACFLPSINVVFGLLGATLGVTCMITYPALILHARAIALENGGPPLEVRFFTPTSATGLRAHAYALYALSFALIVLGTSAYIYQTWAS